MRLSITLGLLSAFLVSFAGAREYNAPLSFSSGGAQAPHVSTNAALVGSSTAAYPNGVWRDDYASDNGAPPLFYTVSGSACSLNSGAGDNGSQVQSADGKCWFAQFPASGPDIREWGAKCDGSTADTTALTNAVAYANAQGLPVIAPGGKTCNYNNTSPLTITANDAGLVGTNGVVTIQGTIAAGDIIKFEGSGQAGGIGYNYRLRNISVISSVAKTSGYAVRVHLGNNTNFSGIILGQSNHSTNLYGGIYYDNSGGNVLDNFSVAATNECVAVSSSTGNADLFLSNGEIGSQCGNAGVHMAGGFGGLVIGANVDIFGPTMTHGVLVDEAYVASPNQQIFIDGFVDTITGDAIYINVPHGMQLVDIRGATIDTTQTAGHGVHVVACACQLLINGVQISNNKGDGIRIDDSTTQLVLGGASQIASNIGFGINYTHAAPNGSNWIEPMVSMFSNASGNYNSTANHHVRFAGPAPAVSACGASASVAGNDAGGVITIGSTVTTTACTITFAAAYSATPTCTLTATSNVVLWFTTLGSTAFTFNSSADMHSTLVTYSCMLSEN